MKNVIISSFILALVLSSCADKAQAPAPAAPILPVLAITSSNANTDAEYPAAIQGAVDVEIRPQVSGNLERVYVDEGAYVAKGQTLFKINERPYREQLNNALASLHAAEAAYINAQLEVDKLTPLVQNKVVSDYQLKTAKASQKIAAANIEQAKAMVGSAKINLGYTNVTAPVSGYIGRLPKKQGSLVGATDPQPLTNLSDVHEVFVYFSLGETDFIKFKEQYAGNTIGEKIKKLPPVSLILADNNAYAQTGKIDMVDGQFDKTTGAITLRATFPNAKGLLRSGNTGRIRLGIQHDDAILVPQSATIEMQDKIFVFSVNKENKVTKTPITISGKSGNNYLIKDGVKAGDQIVLSGIDKLQEGQEIQPEKSTAKVAQIINKK
ncbi:efflux RND transporter periplasmic adaptor subunit [Flavobacterium sp. Fl-77]|uniref:Efflux RND transporter periplasmic adaptor subunit n=1 Tax=Flavobacterium flavipigmentatum TaxID=2893884 RepID=A0AAJ2SBT0_9FLAO|nr:MULTISPECIES: efflux RND transporter periplasmic adaptor subunit [unclassified Flavobacterium]MDX6183777.1 efflux RND transporter periplasmic adaptor subunit [Flavobacterium sp. Fl-33]MDX6187262.1 efflux RND transporter periplasmic adaptor subunit [Flavobacterium sp. Fl-77]UFH38077.1 efflux RND transporter periplasmic adaptor subunit [Flavobacterium sp. F-70]